MAAFEATNGIEAVQDKLNDLTPTNDSQRALLAQAKQLSNEMLQFRWLIIEQSQNTLPALFFVVLLLWLTILYVSIGLIAPRNATVIAAPADLRHVVFRRAISNHGDEPAPDRVHQTIECTDGKGPGSSRPVKEISAKVGVIGLGPEGRWKLAGGETTGTGQQENSPRRAGGLLPLINASCAPLGRAAFAHNTGG